MSENGKFVCAYCGAEYDTPAARGRCEMECDMKRQQEAERDRRKQLEKEKENRWEEVVQAGERYVELYDQFTEDYPRESRAAPTSLWKLLWI